MPASRTVHPRKSDPAPAVTPEQEAESVAEEPEPRYPFPAYNPYVAAEKFKTPESSRLSAFSRGMVIVTNPVEEEAVRGCLRAWTRDPERFYGNDMIRKGVVQMWECKGSGCEFMTGNEEAKYEHLRRHGH